MKPHFQKNISLNEEDLENTKKAEYNGWKPTEIYRLGLKFCSQHKKHDIGAKNEQTH